ncbi:kinase-like protein [Lojkania enalia]|uniref:Kinase-like protein n=1 Tax=Lojkania enalia TaxID=147567 RepID=A0A9P4MY21_9PLEO|nr:kinase-like protein [Didymosphaeria enalia]
MVMCEQMSQSSKVSSNVDEMAQGGPFPYDENVLFRNSSFFTKRNASPFFPSPSVIREVASQSKNPNARLATRPPPVTFPNIGLLVKYGTEVTIAEGQCLLFIRNNLSKAVPVPEVYGWCKDNGQVFIYMELVDGVTLEKSWDAMAQKDRISICQQLRHMVDAWRNLKQNFSPPFIGHVGKQPLLDFVFTNSCSETAGPFSSVSDFHDWFTSAYGATQHVQDKPPHPYRPFLPDNVPIVFTHADLHPSNIILSSGPDPRVVAIIDWHQSGWYPDYWEYCKARWTSWIGQEWETRYLPLILDRQDCYDYWDSFALARGV